jgi:hypothetical protein
VHNLCASSAHNILGFPPAPPPQLQPQKLRNCYCGKRRNCMICKVQASITEYGGKP